MKVVPRGPLSLGGLQGPDTRASLQSIGRALAAMYDELNGEKLRAPSAQTRPDPTRAVQTLEAR